MCRPRKASVLLLQANTQRFSGCTTRKHPKFCTFPHCTIEFRYWGENLRSQCLSIFTPRSLTINGTFQNCCPLHVLFRHRFPERVDRVADIVVTAVGRSSRGYRCLVLLPRIVAFAAGAQVQHVSRDMQGPLGERMMSARRESTSRAGRGGAELTAECSRGRAAPQQPGHWPSSDAGQAPGAMPSVRAGPSTDAEDGQQLPGNTLGSRAPAKLSRSLHLLLHCAFLCPTKIGEQFYLLETGVAP